MKKQKTTLTAFTNLSLVIWGTNLVSSIGSGRLSKQQREMIKLTPYLLGVVVGLLLSDGWLYHSNSSSKNATLGFKQSVSHFHYFWFTFILLSHYCSTFPYFTTGARKGVKFTTVTFITRALPCFTELYPYFYNNKVKVIPSNMYDLLTPVALAHWIMGDGTYKSQGLLLCTDSNTIQDIVRLMNALTIRYDLKCTMHNANPGQYRIYISRKSMPKLISIVKPHMAPCMLFKLGL